MNSLDRIVANEGWRTPRRFALTLAAVFLVVYIAFVVVGSSLQGKLGVPLAMGWFQQFAAIGAAMIFAAMLGEPRTQLGLRAPTSGWVLTASIAAAAIVVGGFLASLALPYEPTRYSLEYFASLLSG